MNPSKEDKTYFHYVRDLSDLIQELYETSGSRGENEFDDGRRFAFFEIISLMQQQADAFQISRESIALPIGDVDP